MQKSRIKVVLLLLLFLCLGIFPPQELQEEKIKKYISQLGDESYKKRKSARRKLLKLGRAVIPYLEKALEKNTDPEIRSAIKYLLKRIPIHRIHLKLRKVIPQKILKKDPQILEKLTSDNPYEVLEVLNGLTGLEIDISAYFRSPYPGKNPRYCLGYNQRNRLVKIIRILLREKAPAIELLRIPLAKIIWCYCLEEKLSKELLDMLKKGHHPLLIRCLGNSRSKEAIPILKDLMKNTDPEVRSTTIRALGKLGAKEMISEFIKLLDCSEIAVVLSAIDALSDLSAKDAVPQIEKFLEYENRWILRNAALALARLGAKTSIPKLKRLLKSKDSTKRDIAIFALGILGEKEVIPRLIRLASSGRPLAVRILNRLRFPSFYKRLKRLKPPLKEAFIRLSDLMNYLSRVGINVITKERGEELIYISTLENLSELMQCFWVHGYSFSFVLEKDHVLFLPQARAVRIFRKWWKEKSRRQK